jgi:uncharacterized membrane protein YkgB
MASTTTFMSFIYNTKRIEAAQNSNVDIDNNATQMIGDGKVIAIAQGVATVQVTGDFVFTNDDTDAAGMTADVINVKTATVSFLFGTKLFSCGVQATKASVKSTSKSGETTMALTLINTEAPKFVG